MGLENVANGKHCNVRHELRIEDVSVSILEAESSVRRVIAKFANSFDARAWDELESCLTDAIYTDYSDLRGTPPESMTRRDYVGACRSALQNLQTQHLTANIEVYINGSTATARVSALIFRRDPAGQNSTTHCLYLLGLQARGDEWAICSLVQRVLWGEGSEVK